jgi:hypothetical protein
LAIRRKKVIAFTGVFILLALILGKLLSPGGLEQFISRLFWPRQDYLAQLYQYKAPHSYRVLIVPGHSNSESGAQYNGLVESNLNIELAYNLAFLLESDPDFSALVSRKPNGQLSNWLSYYIEQEDAYITSFRNVSRRRFQESIARGEVEDRSTPYHNFASTKAAYELYALNHFANANDIEAVIHLHFNDDGERRPNKPGKYKGFTIYVPERQLPNAKESIALGIILRDKIALFFPTSSMPFEKGGFVEDQELIAIGSNASR